MTTAKHLSFDSWLPGVSPHLSWDWSHLAYTRERLRRVTEGESQKLMVFEPPRHGKSEMVTIHYPAYRMERNPSLRVIVGSYNETLAAKFSRRARSIAGQRLELNRERWAAVDWETARGGGLRAVGVGGGVTGHGGQLIIIDDPIKNRDEADSPAYRERVWDWYRDDLYTRLEPGGAIILIMTRWHEDDLAGRILGSEDAQNWEVVRLPALAEEDDPLGREVGAALCPERYDEEALADIRTVLGEHSFAALYQQRPMPLEGGMFKSAWFARRISEMEAGPFDGLIRYWDRAASEGRGDYTAGVLMGRQGDEYVVVDVVRGQWETYERERVIHETAQRDRERWGAVRIWLEQEPGSSGADSVRATIRALTGFPVYAETVTGKKPARADPFAGQAAGGNVRLVRAAWNDAYIEELCLFPHGKHDDQVDATSGAFNKLARTTRQARSYQG
jgi:predicted phage terminase large subunit-like protein